MLEERIKHFLLKTSLFEAWKEYKNKIKVFCHGDCFDVTFEAIGKIDITPQQIDTYFPLEFNGLQREILVTTGYVTCGSPEGGTIRFLFSEGKSYE